MVGKEVCENYGVFGYPTVKLFKNGDVVAEYDGEPNALEIIAYMRSHLPVSREYVSIGELNRDISLANRSTAVGFFNNKRDGLYRY